MEDAASSYVIPGGIVEGVWGFRLGQDQVVGGSRERVEDVEETGPSDWTGCHHVTILSRLLRDG